METRRSVRSWLPSSSSSVSASHPRIYWQEPAMQELGCSSRCPLCRTARRSSSRPGRTRRCRRNRPYRHPRDIAPRTNIARRGETRGLVQLRHRRPQYRRLSHNKPHRTRTGCPGRCSSSAHHRSRTHFNRRTLAHQRPRTGWCPGRGHLVPPSRAEPARWSHRRGREQEAQHHHRLPVVCILALGVSLGWR
jgi:hypothetical protein